jgi:hypothetical protein
MTDHAVCPVNIDAKGKRRRLVLGTVVLAATVVAHFAFRNGQFTPWSAAAAIPLGYAWLCILQALMSTCVVRAAQGTQETEAGVVSVGDDGLVALLKERARRVYVCSALAMLATLGVFYLTR